MKMKDMCAGERPRERMLAHGAAALSDAELLAVVLRNGTRGQSVLDLAREVLAQAGWKLSNLSSSSLESLAAMPGVGLCKAASLCAAMELGRRFVREENASVHKRVTGPKAVHDIMIPEMKGLRHEECWAVFLDTGGRLLGTERVSVGGFDSTVIDGRKIIRRMMEKAASGLILVHNHPGGDPRPSVQDIKNTASLKDAVSACQLSLVDHVIFCDSSWFSFSEDR